jgi:hypothetical protein
MEAIALHRLTTFYEFHPLELSTHPIGLFPAEKEDDPVGTMLRRRRSCGKKQLWLKLLEHDDEDTVYKASGLQHTRS